MTEQQIDFQIHIAGHPVQVGTVLRQRCAWCGAVLIDEDLSRIAVPVDQADKAYPTWEHGVLVKTNVLDGSGGYWTVVEHTEGDPVPVGCCAKLDPAVTA